jgi:hypothetical protein
LIKRVHNVTIIRHTIPLCQLFFNTLELLKRIEFV